MAFISSDEETSYRAIERGTTRSGLKRRTNNDDLPHRPRSLEKGGTRQECLATRTGHIGATKAAPRLPFSLLFGKKESKLGPKDSERCGTCGRPLPALTLTSF